MQQNKYDINYYKGELLLMRIRFKPWARPELEASYFYEDNPEDYKGKWITKFKNKNNPIYLELGCGKGSFISELAFQNQKINYIAIDLVDAMLGLAKRKVEENYNAHNKKVENLILVRYDIERINNIIDCNDNIQRIYINFCNPWPKAKHKKKRLTHTKQLAHYKEFLNPGAEIYFKTDDDGLFQDSLQYFEDSDFIIVKKTYDLHKEDIFNGNNIITEHEKMFSEEGIKIKACIVQLEEK